MAIEGFVCQGTPKPMATWIEEKDPEQCHVCLLKPTASNYLGVLNEANATVQAGKLEQAWDSGDPLTVAKTLDIIKAEVGEPLKRELVELDCFAQNYRPEAAAA